MGRRSEGELKDMAQAQERQAVLTNTGPFAGGVYRHYKGGLYVVVARSIKEDTLEPLVTYRSNKMGTFWTRTLADFLAVIEISPARVVILPELSRASVETPFGMLRLPRFVRVED